MIAKVLSIWITDGEDPLILYRSARSGGRSTQLQKTGVLLGESAGDLQSVRPAGVEFISKFFVELKTYEYLQWDNLVIGGPCKAIKFFEKAKEQARLYSKEPMLIAKQNRAPIMVILPTWIAEMQFNIKVSKFVQYQGVTIFPLRELTKRRYKSNV